MIVEEQELKSLALMRERTLLRHRLVLYAGANYPSDASREAYAPALSAYPAMGPRYRKEQPDTRDVSRLEAAAEAAACALFAARWAETRLPSCTMANLAVFHAFCERGDLLLAPAAAHGGHLSQRRGGTPELAGLRVEDLPFDTRSCRLDAPAAATAIRRLRPRMVMLGRSVMLAPDDIAPVVAAARETGALTVFDASHVSGLIAGGAFPDPLSQGVDIMTSSTYKTIRGRPQGLVVGTRKEHGAALARLLDGRMLANYDAGKLPSLIVTLREAARDGRDYAARIVANTARLAGALRDVGLPVVSAPPGSVHTHQLLVPLSRDGDPAEAMPFLESCGVLVGTCPDPRFAGSHALRIGTQFVTRQGLGPHEMEAVADLLKRLLEPDGVGRARVRQASRPDEITGLIEALLASSSRMP